MISMLKRWGKSILPKALALFALVFLVSVVPHAALAQVDLDQVGESSGLFTGDLFTVIGRLIRVFLGILGVVFLILMLYAGGMWMTAGGDSERVNKAKQTIIRATIGLIITLMAFGITQFVFNALTDAGLIGGGSGQVGTAPGAPPFSNSLGNGGIRDHYPDRNATDVPRNARVIVTFKSPMDIEDFIQGYDNGGTPLDVTDDADPNAGALNDNLITIFPAAQGEDAAFTSNDTTVAFTEDLKTFVFQVPLMGSSVEDTIYTVQLSDRLQSAEGDQIIDDGGYEWSFTVGTTIDLTAPHVRSVIPIAGNRYARNIIVQVNFSEAVDPVAASGFFAPGDPNQDFDHISVIGELAGAVAGSYEISNGYKTVTFVTTDACGTNSCGETLYCLPASENFDVTVQAATPGADPPQVDFYPYDGIADVAGNALDGNNDGDAGDNYTWEFSTNNAIELRGPEIKSITPNIMSEDVPLDQPVQILWNDVLMSSTATSENILFRPNPDHELWFGTRTDEIQSEGNAVTSLTIPHGILLESSDDQSYLYDILVTEGVRNQYQNCYNPAIGPDENGGMCTPTDTQPYCCNGVPSVTSCVPRNS